MKTEVLLPEKYLEVGLTPDGREVIINHPDLLPDANGVGHIVFSPEQARNLARLLLRKADLCKRPSNWFDGGYLENGHCSFMQAMNGAHYFCCLPHAHKGPHRTDSQSIKGSES